MLEASTQEEALSASPAASGNGSARLVQLRQIKTKSELEAAAYDAAKLIRAGEIEKPDAIDGLMEIAHSTGIFDHYGDDAERIILGHIVAGIAKFDLEARELNNGLDARASEATDLTEDALAILFTQRYGKDLRYVAGWRQWFRWTGTHWEFEPTLIVFDFARAICREVASSCASPSLRGRLASATTVAAIERLVRADRQHAARTDVWDTNPWSLNTQAGLVDLRTGALAPHKRDDNNTKIAAASPCGKCPAWLLFLETVTGSDLELQAYLQRVVGYCLTGVTSEHAVFFLYGTGANGKTVFLQIIASILGPYAAVCPMDTLMVTKGEQHPTDMAGLRGARLVTATETEQGRRWAESKLKTLTGGDKITARFMRQDFFEFVPQFKLVVAGNHKPTIRNVDEAMRRRLHLIPFTVTIPPSQRDTKLTEKLLAERDGILAWTVAGCLEWQRIGLKPPAAVLSATEEYFKSEDAVGRWLDEACEMSPNRTETTAALYAAWKVWAEANGEFIGSTRRFSEELARHGIERHSSRRARGFQGLCLKSNSHDFETRETER